MGTNRHHHDHRQHDKRVGASARHDAIRHVEKVDGDREDEKVDGDGEYPDGHKVAPRVGEALAESISEFIIAGTLMQGCRTAAASTASPAVRRSVTSTPASIHYGWDRCTRADR